MITRMWKDTGKMSSERNSPSANKEAEVIGITCTVNNIYWMHCRDQILFRPGKGIGNSLYHYHESFPKNVKISVKV
jgi:hypothetical protein